jgi:hypothetical protein
MLDWGDFAKRGWQNGRNLLKNQHEDRNLHRDLHLPLIELRGFHFSVSEPN